MARHWGCEVYVFTRSGDHQKHARELGAAQDEPPKKLDRAAGSGAVARGGDAVPYHLLWEERTIRSVANATRQDAEAFLSLAAKIPVMTTTQGFDLSEANRALSLMKDSALNGAAVLHML